MKNTFSIVTSIFLVLSQTACDKPEEKFDVSVYVVRYEAIVWYFGIYINDELVFGATECGTGHPDAEQCVEFTEPFLVLDKSYEYKTTLKEGDKIQVIADTPMYQSCYGSLSTWIYVDGELVESDIDDSDDQGNNCLFFSSCQTTL